MKYTFFLLFILFFLASSCSKPKTVLICGDHICVNKDEAQKYFEDNLSLEVKIIHKENKKQADLVELNLEKNDDGKKKIKIVKKIDTDKNLKKLTKKEVTDIKKNIKKSKNKKKEFNKISQKKIKKDEKEKDLKKNELNKRIVKKSVNKRQEDIVDICTILDKCNINEISKYLLEQGRKKDYPDITERQ